MASLLHVQGLLLLIADCYGPYCKYQVYGRLVEGFCMRALTVHLSNLHLRHDSVRKSTLLQDL